MMIRGIRSFGPDDRDKQVIQFFTPLTLILGLNGTGKTTIIECLKYVSTGEFPPGASKGGAFVHDPKIANESEVRGQVKLAFHDVTGSVVCVTRSLQVTQKYKTQTCKTLENAIQRKNKNGETKSISSKCADIDKEMVASLGVSKAVLENVIFCHQEDSNWPLGEGRYVKNKFDDIFASTRYVKALEIIRKLRKDQTSEVKVNQNNLIHLKKHKERAAQLQNDLAKAQTRNESALDSLQALQSQIEPVEDKLTDIEHRSRDIYRLQTQIEKCQSEQKEMERTRDDMEKKIEREFQGTMDELKRAIDEFNAKLRKQRLDLSKNESRMDQLNDELNKLQRKRSELLTEQGKLQHEAKVHADNIEKRNDLIKKSADHYKFAGFSRVSEDSVNKFMDELKAKKESYMQDARRLRTEFDEKEAEVQAKIDAARDSKTKLEQTQQLKSDQIKQYKADIKRLTSELQRVEASAGNLDSIQREISLKTRQLEDTENEFDLDQLRNEVKALQTERTDLDRKVKDLDCELVQLHQESDVRTQLSLLKKDKTSKEDNIKRLKNRHEETFSHLLDEMPSTGFRARVDDYIQKLGRSIQDENKKIQAARLRVSQLETQCKMTRDQLKNKEEELKEYDDQLFDLCGGQNFDDGLNKLQDKIKMLRSEKGPLEGTKYMFERYVNMLKKRDPVCPLCKREFDEQQEVEELIQELERNMTLLPNKMEAKERELTQCTEKYEKMVQMKPKMETRSSLCDVEIPELKEKIRNMTAEIEQVKNEISTMDESMTLMQSDESLARNVQPDAAMLDRYLNEIRALEKDIVKNEAKINDGGAGRSIEAVSSEKSEKQLELEQANQLFEYKREKINRQTERIHDLKQSLNELKSEKLQIETDLQKRIKLEENKRKLTDDILTLEDEVQEAKEQSRPLEEKISQYRADRERIVREKDAAIEGAKKLMENLKEHGTAIANVQSEINRYVSEKRAVKLETCEEKLFELDQSQTRLKREQSDVTRIIDEIKDDLANQQVRERELEDNVKLREKREQISTLSRKISELKDKLGDFDAMNLDRQRRELQAELDNLTREKHTVEGRQREMKVEINRLENELKSDDYAQAPKNYQEELINVKTMEIANSDLDKYYQALDWSIMRYHSLKMDEINEIMSELWRNTYQGNDIDSIEIRADEDPNSGTTNRRQYNYRVVMVKAGVAIDMRNRCSAGQKVLASLIIRLALAETFCHKCGILALDEPTTNLDRENIESLAFALVEIIKSRRNQRNFQLVVITHDEDFVELLGSSDFVDNFFRIGRNSQGKSVITKENIGKVRK